MSEKEWLKDQLQEVRQDLNAWSEARRDVMRREVNSGSSTYPQKRNTPKSTVVVKRQNYSG